MPDISAFLWSDARADERRNGALPNFHNHDYVIKKKYPANRENVGSSHSPSVS